MPINDLVQRPDRGALPLVRTEPIQERSAARIDALLDAAAEVVDEVGFDRLTTAMVAEGAQASIGTVYRYFPDRIALLQGLRDRAVQRFRASAALHLESLEPATWQDAVDLLIKVLVDMYRTEKGFRIMRFVDAERSAVEAEHDRDDIDFFARTCAGILHLQYGLPEGEELTFRIATGVEIADALIGRAFANGPEPDERFVDEASVVVRAYLGSFYA